MKFLKDWVRKLFRPQERLDILSPGYYRAVEDVRALFGELDFRDGRQMYAVIGMRKDGRKSRLQILLDAIEESKLLSSWEVAGVRLLADRLVAEAWSHKRTATTSKGQRHIRQAREFSAEQECLLQEELFGDEG